MKNVLEPLAKSVLTPLRLTAAAAAAAATDATIHEKVFGSGITTLIISNSIEESALLIKEVRETIKKKAKKTNKKTDFLVCY